MIDRESVSLTRIANYLERIVRVQEEQHEMGKAALLKLKEELDFTGLRNLDLDEHQRRLESLDWASSILLDEDEEDADSNVEDPVRAGWGCVLIAIAMSILLLSMSALMGCKSCEPVIEYEEVIVEVPIATDNEPLPVPDNVVCEQQDSEEWRDSALFIKECFDSLLRKIEEYHHIITSHNETVSQ